MTVVSVFALDRAGRKPLLLGGISVMAVSLFGIATAYFFEDEMSQVLQSLLSFLMFY